MVGYSNGCFQDGRYDTSVIGQFKVCMSSRKLASFPTRLASWSKPGTFHQNDLRLATHGITIEHGDLII